MEFDDHIALTVLSMNKDDAGRFELMISNDSGFGTCAWNLNVTGLPGPPTGPLDITEISPSQAVLHWLPPREDGGSKVSHYVIEKRDTARDEWLTVASMVKEHVYCVQGLYDGHEYEFRVSAANINGPGPPLNGDGPIVARLPFGKTA